MSSRCKTCNEAITNGDFIECDGMCGDQFHARCVSMNKTMLSAGLSCPNIHWYCIECNSGNKSMSTSLDNMREAIGSMTKAFSQDLFNGLRW